MVVMSFLSPSVMEEIAKEDEECLKDEGNIDKDKREEESSM